MLLDLQTGKVVDEFQQYVLPRDNPKLSDFCKTLTGISQVKLHLYDCCQRIDSRVKTSMQLKCVAAGVSI